MSNRLTNLHPNSQRLIRLYQADRALEAHAPATGLPAQFQGGGGLNRRQAQTAMRNILTNLHPNLQRLITKRVQSPKNLASLSKTCKSMRKVTEKKRFDQELSEKMRKRSLRKLQGLLRSEAWESFIPGFEEAYNGMGMDPSEFFQFSVYGPPVLRRKLKQINVSNNKINDIVSNYTIHYNRISNTNLVSLVNKMTSSRNQRPPFNMKNWERMHKIRKMYRGNQKKKTAAATTIQRAYRTAASCKK